MLKKLQNKIEQQPAYYVNQKIKLPIYVFNLKDEIDADDIIRRAYKLKKDNELSNMKIFVKDGFQTEYLKNKDEFVDLCDVIESKVKIVTHLEYKIREYWFVFYNKGTKHIKHNHQTSPNMFGLSAVYYPADSENASPIIFENWNENMQNEEIKLSPCKNRLILFHSSLYHHVPKCDETPRIAFSCNLQI